MLTTTIEDGLGNQLFRLAALYSYAKRDNYKPVVKHLIPYPHRQNYWQTIFHKIPNYDALDTHHWINIRDNNIPSPLTEPCIRLQGYFQEERHFSAYRNELLDLFTVPAPYNDKVDKIWQDYKGEWTNPLIAIHIRRGDYLLCSHILTNLSLNYYKDAFRLLDQQIPGSKRFLVFSDDLPWCHKFLPVSFPDRDFMFTQGHDEITDLLLLTKVDGYILANSTFSWFGWYLNQRAYQVPVIAPRKWFVTQPSTILSEHFTLSDIS